MFMNRGQPTSHRRAAGIRRRPYSGTAFIPLAGTHILTLTLRFSPRLGSLVSFALANSKAATAALAGPSHNCAVRGSIHIRHTLRSVGPLGHHTSSVFRQTAFVRRLFSPASSEGGGNENRNVRVRPAQLYDQEAGRPVLRGGIRDSWNAPLKQTLMQLSSTQRPPSHASSNANSSRGTAAGMAASHRKCDDRNNKSGSRPASRPQTRADSRAAGFPDGFFVRTQSKAESAQY
jgi:hypothetical protein